MIKITKDDVIKNTQRKIKIEKSEVLKPIRVLNLDEIVKVDKDQILIKCNGQRESKFTLKNGTDTYLSVSDNSGDFVFKSIYLRTGTNSIEVYNQEYPNINLQKITFSVHYEKKKPPFHGMSDPITGKNFKITDVDLMLRCKNCRSFYFKTSLLEIRNICNICRQTEFVDNNDTFFFESGISKKKIRKMNYD